MVLARTLAGCALVGVACATSPPANPAGAPHLFVANAGDETVAEFVAATGAPSGPPVAVGPGIQQLVAGSTGTLFVVSRRAGAAVQRPDTRDTGYVVSQLIRQRQGSWRRRTLTMPSMSALAEPLVAADGGPVGGHRLCAAGDRREWRG